MKCYSPVVNKGTDLQYFATNLGKPEFHLVEMPSAALINEVPDKIPDLSKKLFPRETKHVLIKKLTTPHRTLNILTQSNLQ
jgi:hypothetical protein